eukprot:gene4407-4828_t
MRDKKRREREAKASRELEKARKAATKGEKQRIMELMESGALSGKKGNTPNLLVGEPFFCTNPLLVTREGNSPPLPRSLLSLFRSTDGTPAGRTEEEDAEILVGARKLERIFSTLLAILLSFRPLFTLFLSLLADVIA